LLEVSDAVLYRGDVPRARKAAHARVARIAEDFWEIFLVWPFLYETYRFGLATLLFGVLVPIELVGRLVGLLCCPEDTRRRAREQTQATTRAQAAEAEAEAKARASERERGDDYWSFQRRMRRRREAAGSLTQARLRSALDLARDPPWTSPVSSQ
jgi:hypothetical protein